MSFCHLPPLPFSDGVFVTSNLYIIAKISGIRGAEEKGVKTQSLSSDSIKVNSNYAIYANLRKIPKSLTNQNHYPAFCIFLAIENMHRLKN